MRNVQNWLIEGSRLNCSGCGTQAKRSIVLIIVRHEGSRHFWKKKGEYLKDKINKLESNSKNKNI
jgi:alpha/beta superfamily hydrolase